jgi:hypothetical protein
VSRTLAARLVGLPIAIAGVEAAHALANAAFGSPREGAELFESARSGAALLPLVGALALASVLVGAVARALGGGTPRSLRTLALPFALLPPAAFLLLELIEASFAPGRLLAPATGAGLALQLPFAFAGYLAARALLRLGERVGRLLAARAAPPLPAPILAPRRPPAGRPLPLRRAFAHSGRAPPGVLAPA